MDEQALGRKVAFLEQQLDDDAVGLVRAYVERDAEGRPAYTGREFERLAGGGSRGDVADTFTAADLSALSLLGVPVGGSAVLELLDDPDERWSRYLSRISVDDDPATESGRSQLIDPDSAAHGLWQAVRRVSGMGPTRTAKLLARKRPRLIPVYDSVIEGCVAPSANWWGIVAEFFGRRDPADRLVEIRDAAGAADVLSPLRTLDVILWMRFRGPVEG